MLLAMPMVGRAQGVAVVACMRRAQADLSAEVLAAVAAEVLAAVAVALTFRAPEAVPQSEPTTGESARGLPFCGCSCRLPEARMCAAALVVVPLAREAAEPALAVAPAFS